MKRYTTTDLESFTPLHPEKVQQAKRGCWTMRELTKSARKVGLLEGFPVLVDANRVLLDGHFRWLVARKLNLPLHVCQLNQRETKKLKTISEAI